MTDNNDDNDSKRGFFFDHEPDHGWLYNAVRWVIVIFLLTCITGTSALYGLDWERVP